MSRQATSRRSALRQGWMVLCVLLLAAAAPAAADVVESGRTTPGFERIEMPVRSSRPAGDGFERIGPPRPAAAANERNERRVSVARARPDEPPAPDMPPVPPRAPARRSLAEPWRDGAFAPPTPEGVENYRRRLEARLLEKYNNNPEWAGKVAGVTVVLSRPLETSVDGTMIRADFDQLVHDAWGKRIPELEREYFVVTFGSDGVRQVRSDPSIRVGLDLEKTYSERSPLSGDPFRGVAEAEAFGPAARGNDWDNAQDNERDSAQGNARGGMPAWWRPAYPEP